MNRRDFIAGSAAFVAASGLGFTRQDPLFRISLAEWSLHRRLGGRQKPRITNLDFPKVARSFGLDAVEYVNQCFFDKAQEMAYLTELKTICEGEGVQSLLIMCDREGNLGDPDEAMRTQAVENHHKWVEAAKFLGCHSIRVNARSDASLSF